MKFEFDPVMSMEEAARQAQGGHADQGIGTYAERRLHSTLKSFFCPDAACHEVKFKGCIADILISRETKPLIIEIQTRQLFKLQRKLIRYGEDADVVIVYPVLADKKTAWVDPTDGRICTKLRQSPKKRTRYSAYRELSSIKKFLNKENICVCLMLLRCEEYRFLDGWSQDRKKGAHRADVVPTDLLEVILLNSPEAYSKLIPEDLPGEFTADLFAKSAKVSVPDARLGLNLLAELGLVCEKGKQGRKKLWTLSASL